MKYINIVLTDEEFEKLLELKHNLKLNWHDFLIKLLELPRK